MNDIQITEHDTKIRLRAPFSPDANDDYKRLGGKWDSDRRAWTFDVRDTDALRKILTEHFGCDDRGAGQTVTVRVNLTEGYHGNDNEVRLFGRLLAHRRNRDADVVLGSGVILNEGYFSGSGGSMKYPDIGKVDGIILEVRDVPATHTDLQGAGIEIISEDAPNMDALAAEREALLARLAEIDALLPEPEGTEMSTQEAAVALGVSVRTVQRWATTGKVAATKNDAGRWIITITL